MIIDKRVLPHLGDHRRPVGGLPLRGMREAAAVEPPIAVEALVRNDPGREPVRLRHQAQEIVLADRLGRDMPEAGQRRTLGQDPEGEAGELKGGQTREQGICVPVNPRLALEALTLGLP